MNTLKLIAPLAAAIVLSACAGGGGRTAASDAAVANMNLGAGYLQQGNTTLAIERLQRALALDPRLVQAHSTLALAYDQIGSLDEAETHFRRATQLAPSNGAAANAYAVFLCRQRRWSDAETYFRAASADLTYATPEVALTNAGVCARDAGDTEAAMQNFRAALVRNARYPDALLNMMEISHESGNFLQARAFVQRYLEANPATASVLLLCYRVERELDDDEAADRCAARLRNGFRGTDELQQLEELTGRNDR